MESMSLLTTVPFLIFTPYHMIITLVCTNNANMIYIETHSISKTSVCANIIRAVSNLNVSMSKPDVWSFASGFTCFKVMRLIFQRNLRTLTPSHHHQNWEERLHVLYSDDRAQRFKWFKLPNNKKFGQQNRREWMSSGLFLPPC